MFTKLTKKAKQDKGFTMIELIIVVAIMGILSAIAVPSFTSMTRKSKLTADIRSLQQIQHQVDIYMAEHEGNFPGGSKPTDQTTYYAMIKALRDGEYIKESDTEAGGVAGTYKFKFQTKSIEIRDNSGQLVLTFNATPAASSEEEKVNKLMATLGTSDKTWVSPK